MKVLFFTDTHGDIPALFGIREKIIEQDVKLAVCGGDLSVFGGKITKLLKIIDTFGIPILMMPGNHESDEELQKACKKTNNISFINNGYFSHENLLIVCIEGSGFSRKDRSFERTSSVIFRDAIKPMRREFGSKLSYVLVTHAPPYKTTLDDIGYEHVGNNSIRKFILYSKPKFAFSGHIHESEEQKDKIGGTRVYNPGMYGMVFDI